MKFDVSRVTNQNHIQHITDLLSLHIIVGIHIQEASGMICADVRSKQFVRIEVHFHVELQIVIRLDNLVSKLNVTGIQRTLSAQDGVLMLVVDLSSFQSGSKGTQTSLPGFMVFLHCEVRSCRNTTASECLPTTRCMQCREFSGIHVDVESTCHPFGLFQPFHNCFIEFPMRNRNCLFECVNELAFRIVRLALHVASQFPCSMKRIHVFVHAECPVAFLLPNMEYSKASAGFRIFLCLLFFLPNLMADPCVFMFRQFVAQLVDHLFQMFFQRFIFQMFVDGIVPALI